MDSRVWWHVPEIQDQGCSQRQTGIQGHLQPHKEFMPATYETLSQTNKQTNHLKTGGGGVEQELATGFGE